MKLDVVYNKSSQQMDELPDESIDMVMTSPPYWGLRDYGKDVVEKWGSGLPMQLGLEPTFQLYLDHMMIVCAEIKRVLKKTGSFWLNMGDTYGGSGGAGGDYNTGGLREGQPKYKQTRIGYEKCLIGIPWRLVLCLIDEQGWILRNAIIWHKPNAMPSSVKDRCSNSYEHLFHLVKAKKYYYDLDAIRESHAEFSKLMANRGYKPSKPRGDYTDDVKAKAFNTMLEKRGIHLNPAGKNPGDVWLIATQPRPEAHFATFPDKLCIKPILATCPAEICKKCGKARVRITKRESIARNDIYKGSKFQNEGKNYSHKRLQMMVKAGRAAGLPHDNPLPPIETIGWTDCGCNAGWDSGILLDPFTGRGTALIMAKKLGRHYVGYELKREYADMAERELNDIDPLFRRR